MRLKILAVGDPVLRTTARALTPEDLLSSSVQDLIEHMRETVRDAPGVGLAAPQIGEPLQLLVIEDRVEYHKGLSDAELIERGRREIPFHVVVNPVLERLPGEDALFFEGCLSLPGFTALVPRASAVRVHCLDRKGHAQVIEATGWYARILQHEIDHLRGTLYIDRMQPSSFSTTDNYTRHWKNKIIG